MASALWERPPQPQSHLQANGETRNALRQARKKKVLPPQVGIYNWAVILFLPPSTLPSCPGAALRTPDPEREALSSPMRERVTRRILRCCVGTSISAGAGKALGRSRVLQPGPSPVTFARPSHRGTQEGSRGAPRWQDFTCLALVSGDRGPRGAAGALALWLPCVALHPASCRGQVWGPPSAAWGPRGCPALPSFVLQRDPSVGS